MVEFLTLYTVIVYSIKERKTIKNNVIYNIVRREYPDPILPGLLFIQVSEYLLDHQMVIESLLQRD